MAPVRREHRFFRSPVIRACALFAALLFGRDARAARLLEVHYEVGGRTVLVTYYEDDGKPDAATVWRYLGRPPIDVHQAMDPSRVDDPEPWMLEGPNVPADPADPLHATLSGEISIRMSGANVAKNVVETDRLSLVRDDPTKEAWYLPPGEVERTAKLAGLGPPARKNDDSLWLWFVGVVVVAVLLLGFARYATR